MIVYFATTGKCATTIKRMEYLGICTNSHNTSNYEIGGVSGWLNNNHTCI